MMSLCWKWIRFPLVIVLITACVFALYASEKGVDFDPVKEILRLREDNRRDDALDMLHVFRNGKSMDSATIKKLEQDLVYTPAEKIRSLVWDGAIKGVVFDKFSGIGAIGADLMVWGDIRDILKQSWNYMIDRESYDQLVMILSAAGVGLSSTTFVNGGVALAKSTIKYLKRVPDLAKKGLLSRFLSGKMTPSNAEKVWTIFKNNGWSIPRTASNLAHISKVKHLDTAVGVIGKHGRSGSVFVNMTGDTGLRMYASLPKRLRHSLINAFKRNPRRLVGISTSHLVIHSIKIFDKYGLSALVVPFSALILLLSQVSVWVIWMVLVFSVGYLHYLVFRRRKHIVEKVP